MLDDGEITPYTKVIRFLKIVLLHCMWALKPSNHHPKINKVHETVKNMSAKNKRILLNLNHETLIKFHNFSSIV